MGGILTRNAHVAYWVRGRGGFGSFARQERENGKKGAGLRAGGVVHSGGGWQVVAGRK